MTDREKDSYERDLSHASAIALGVAVSLCLSGRGLESVPLWPRLEHLNRMD